jgi:hypothetical protein
MDFAAVFVYPMGMVLDWKRRSILRFLAEGCTLGEAARLARIHRQTLLRWRWENPNFASMVDDALGQGREQRDYLLWLRHPFRGLRPPTGKGNGGKPRFSVGRR